MQSRLPHPRGAAVPFQVSVSKPDAAEILPIHSHKQAILDQVNADHRVTILSAETGAGKSTTVPIMILESMLSQLSLSQKPRILISQPRRIAAIRLSERVRDQIQKSAHCHPTSAAHDRLQHRLRRVKVGYRIMNEVMDESSEILFATVGYLVSWLAKNEKALQNVTHVVLDEAHERSVDMDLLSLLLRRRLSDPNMKFKVVVMSATLDTQLYMDYFWTKTQNDAESDSDSDDNSSQPVFNSQYFTRKHVAPKPIEVGARRFPVKRIYLEEMLSSPLLKPIFDLDEPDFVPEQESPQFAQDSAEEHMVSSQLKSFVTGKVVKFNNSANSKTVTSKRKAGQLVGAIFPQIQLEDYDLAVRIALQMGGMLQGKSRKRPSLVPPSVTSLRPASVISSTTGHQFNDTKEGECILVFLPGEAEILAWQEALARNLQNFKIGPGTRSRIHLHVLHSQTPREELDSAFHIVPPGHLKIVLSTNIAESSVTIPDVTAVIDHGLRRALEFNATIGCQMLKLGWVSRASSKQREGRTGRCREGLFFAFYTQPFHDLCFKEHDPPEILTLSLEQTILKVKGLFPGEPLHDLFGDMIEPPEADQLDTAISMLQALGGLTREQDPSTKSSTGSTNPDPFSITFLGNIVPMFPCDVTHTRMLIFALAAGIATDGAVLAAAFSAQDPFSSPHSSVNPDRANLGIQLACAFGGRYSAEAGTYSEVLCVYNIFKDWLKTPRKNRQQFLMERAIVGVRFRQFRAIVSMLANRLADLCSILSKKPGTSASEARQGALTREKLKKLAAMAADVDHLDIQGIKEGVPEDETAHLKTVDYVLSASDEAMRSVILAGLSTNIFHGIPSQNNVDLLNSSSEVLRQLEESASPESSAQLSKKAKKRMEKLLTAELFGSNSPQTATSTLHASSNVTRLALFRECVPQLPNELPVNPTVMDGVLSYHPDFYQTAESRFKPFERQKTVVFEIANKAPPVFFDARTIRKTLEWMGCIRVLVKDAKVAFVELADPATDSVLTTNRIDALANMMNGVSLNTPSEPIINSKRSRTTKEVSQIVEPDIISDMRLLSRGDCCAAAKFLLTLSTGRPWSLWLPFWDSAQAVLQPEGFEAGKVSAVNSMVWHSKSMPYVARFPWKCTFSTMTADSSYFAAAGSYLMLSSGTNDSLALNMVTLYPAKSLVWNLRMLVLSDQPFVYLNTKDSISMIQHFHDTAAVQEDQALLERTNIADSLSSYVLYPEDLYSINNARKRLGSILYNGEGILSEMFAESFISGISDLAEEMSLRTGDNQMEPTSLWVHLSLEEPKPVFRKHAQEPLQSDDKWKAELGGELDVSYGLLHDESVHVGESALQSDAGFATPETEFSFSMPKSDDVAPSTSSWLTTCKMEQRMRELNEPASRETSPPKQPSFTMDIGKHGVMFTRRKDNAGFQPREITKATGTDGWWDFSAEYLPQLVWPNTGLLFGEDEDDDFDDDDDNYDNY